MSSEKSQQNEALQTKRWEKPELRRVGDVADIVQGGGGKLSLLADDTGDAPRKPKGQE
jgi:hypothetical protein